MIRGLLLLRKALSTPGLNTEVRNQIKYLFLGLGIYFFCALDFLQVYGAHWYPIGTFFFLLSFLVITYALTKHRLLDVHIAIKKITFYSMLAVGLSVLYVVAIFIAQRLFLAKNTARSTLLGSIVLVVLITLLLKPLETFLHRVLDKKFFKGTIAEISEEKEKLQRELERRERLKSVGILAAGMAHEIKNPITVIKTFADHLPAKYGDAEFREKFLRIVNQEINRIKEIVSDLLLFSKPSEPQKQGRDPQLILSQIIDLLSVETINNGVQVNTEFGSIRKALIDAEQIKQALLNIVMNSLDAMRGRGGMLSISTMDVDSFVEVRIQDTGCGIPPEKIAHIFDPFFTEKAHGTGLGLAITHSIIEKHGGKISVESMLGEGTVFSILLPAV